MPLINTKLISHPVNWIIIILMLVIAAMFGHLLLTILEQEPALKTPTGLTTDQTGGQ